MVRTFLTLTLATLVFAGTARAGQFALEANESALPIRDDAWHFTLTLPGWVPSIIGDMGLNGKISHVDLGPRDIVPKWDMVADVRAEAHKGRFSILGELLYSSTSDGIGAGTVVKKLDFQIDQTIAGVGICWRILEGPRWFVDVIGGVRYTNLYQKIALQPNDSRIDEVAGRLARAGTAVRRVLARELRTLDEREPGVPVSPLASAEPEQLARRVEHVKGKTAERQEKIATLLHRSLSRTAAHTDDWWDPYIGLRGRLDLNQTFYLTAKGDVGGFCVGSDLSWTAEGAIGAHLTRYIIAELGYRALGMDYDRDGLLVDTITHGAQLTVGVTF